MTLQASATRTSGISPLLVLFDASGTTDTAVRKTTPFQDVLFTWDFGDSGSSGTGTWRYGSNPGKNLKNRATGGVAAHLYVTPEKTDASYRVTVTAYDGRDTASCQLAINAFEPGGRHGFPTSHTTCVASSTKPVPGRAGCPAGARTLATSSFNRALEELGNGKRILFKCGDTFTGDDAILRGKTWSVGAYGSCEGSLDNRPIIQDSGTNGQFTVATEATGDGRVSDLAFQGNNAADYAIRAAGDGASIPYQITLLNLRSEGNDSSFSWPQGSQMGIVDSVVARMRTHIGVFLNFAENNQAQWTSNPFNSIDYLAVLGNWFDGAGGTRSDNGQETLRISACRLCVLENNTIENANNIGAVLKLHSGNTYRSLPAWAGFYTEFVEIADNRFSGTSGAQLVETSPQNSADDERLRNIVVERNIFSGSTNAQGGRLILVSAVNETLRNNVFYMPGTSSQFPIYGIQVAERGAEPVPRGVEVYNNTCYAPNAIANQTCVGFDGVTMAAPPVDSYAENNLFYVPAPGHTTVTDKGSGNLVQSNATRPETNPQFVNSSGQLMRISDFGPTAHVSGGARVPVWEDALGASHTDTWALGAVSR